MVRPSSKRTNLSVFPMGFGSRIPKQHERIFRVGRASPPLKLPGRVLEAVSKPGASAPRLIQSAGTRSRLVGTEVLKLLLVSASEKTAQDAAPNVIHAAHDGDQQQ